MIQVLAVILLLVIGYSIGPAIGWSFVISFLFIGIWIFFSFIGDLFKGKNKNHIRDNISASSLEIDNNSYLKEDTSNLFKEEEIIYYEKANSEIENNKTNKGIWAKAFVDTDGNTEKTQALYIKYRAASLINEEKEKLKHEQDVLDNLEIERLHKVNLKKEAKLKRSNYISFGIFLLIMFTLVSYYIL